MSLSLRVELIEDTLLGGDCEAVPRLAVWATWGAHRLASKTPPLGQGVLTLGPYALPALDATRGDENVWFKEVAATHRSGIPSIDALEQTHVTRSLLEGTGALALRDLLKAALAGASLDVPLEQIMLQVQLAAESQSNVPKLDDMARKGTLRVTPVLVDAASKTAAPALHRRLETQWNAGGGGASLLYAHPRFLEAHLAQINATIGEAYTPTFYASASGGPPEWPIGRETSLDKLHLPRFMSDQGSQPAVAFLLHDVETRDHPPGSDIRAHAHHYALNADSARFFNDLVLGAARREGFTETAFVAAVVAQEARAPTDAKLSADYLRAEAAAHDLGTYVANAMHYKSDMVWKNRAYYQLQAPALNAADADVLRVAASQPLQARRRMHVCTVPNVAHSVCLAAVQALPAMLRTTATPEAKHAAAVIEATEMESFDPWPVQGVVNSGDCEDMSNMGSTVLRMVTRVAALPEARQYPALQAAARILGRRLVLDVAASVTAAFVNTEGKELSSDELKTIKDLPLIGSPEDARKKEGGHCHGLSQSEWSVYSMLCRAHGQARIDADLPQLARRALAAPAWAKELPTVVLEGTSSIEPWVLPAGELHPDLGAAALARRNFAKAVRAAAPSLVATFKLEGLSFYTSPQTEQRRVSSFYLGISQLMSPELYAQNPLYGQLGAVDTKDHTRGLEIGQYLRAALPGHALQSTAGLVPAFYRLGRERWESEVRPVMACIQNQMPLNAFARFAAPERPHMLAAEPARLALNHPLALPAVKALAQVPEVHLEAKLEKHARALSARPAQLTLEAATVSALPLAAQGTSSSSTDTAHVSFYTRPWRLAQDAALGGKLEQELAALQRQGYLRAYRFVHDRPLPHADSVVTLEMALAVPGPGAPPEPASTPAPVPAPAVVAVAVQTWELLGTPFWQSSVNM